MAIAYREWDGADERPPVILQHGFAVDALVNWVHPGVVEALLRAGRRVWAPDARGHGRSDAPHDPALYGEATMAGDVLALVDLIGADRVDLVGYSMGAVVSLLVAARDRRVRRLVVGGVGAAVVELGGVDTRVVDPAAIVAALTDEGPGATADAGAVAFRRFADASGADRIALAAQASRRHAKPIELARIAAPTLVLAGDADPLATRPQVLADAIPGRAAGTARRGSCGGRRRPALRLAHRRASRLSVRPGLSGERPGGCATLAPRSATSTARQLAWVPAFVGGFGSAIASRNVRGPPAAEQESHMSSQSFADLGVSGAVVSALSRQGVTSPFTIQRLVIGDVLAGRDVLVRSPTGSGKTLAFAVPMVECIESTDPRPSALIIAPTRELVSQIADEMYPIAHARALRVSTVYGGVGLQRQMREAQRSHILVATPGRLEDLLARRAFGLDQVRMLVLDEADRMLDMGFRPAVDRIVRQCPSKRQTLFFSATLDGETGRLAAAFTTDPVSHEHDPPAPRGAAEVTHRFLSVEHHARTDALVEALRGRR